MEPKAKSIPPCKELEVLLAESNLRGKDVQVRYPDRKFFGFFCSYFPEELILAAGFEPLRILPPPGSANPSELPSYCCSLARGSLAMGIRGGLKDLAGIGFAHTCDTMQCLSGIWAERIDRRTTITLVPPVMLDAPGAQNYTLFELACSLEKLSALSGKVVQAADLQAAIELCQKIRRLVAELDGLRDKVPSQIMSGILRAGQLMPRDIYLQNLIPTVEYLKAAYTEVQGTKVLVTGAVFEDDSLFAMLEELGARVVADDTCTGSRHFQQTPGLAVEDPLNEIAHRLVTMPPCPCRNGGLERRLDYLTELAKTSGARGIVIALRKFCEPHAWDAVPLSQRCKEQGLKVLVLELEGSEVGGPERTRLQAFLESF